MGAGIMPIGAAEVEGSHGAVLISKKSGKMCIENAGSQWIGKCTSLSGTNFGGNVKRVELKAFAFSMSRAVANAETYAR